jgi:peptide/nickel transport system permease protein
MLDIKSEALLDFWRRFSRNKAALLGFVTVCSLAVIAVLTPTIAPYDPSEMHLENQLKAPSLGNLFGTDQFGRDVFSRVLYGTIVSLTVGFSAVVVSFSIGVTVGLISGYSGGKIDEILMRATDAFLILPTFFLIIMAAAVFGSSMSFTTLMIGFTRWPTPARLVRAEALSIKRQPFVEAAKLIGAGRVHMVIREIAPNVLFPAIINGSMTVSSAIMLEASLAFLGLGDPNVISWGWMLNNAMSFFSSAWWLSTFPGLAICIVAVAFNVIGDGLNDALNPHLKER